MAPKMDFASPVAKKIQRRLRNLPKETIRIGKMRKTTVILALSIVICLVSRAHRTCKNEVAFAGENFWQ